jgi:hypothetical protein
VDHIDLHMWLYLKNLNALCESYVYFLFLYDWFTCTVHICFVFYGLFHVLWSFSLTLNPCNVIMYVYVYVGTCIYKGESVNRSQMEVK